VHSVLSYVFDANINIFVT